MISYICFKLRLKDDTIYRMKNTQTNIDGISSSQELMIGSDIDISAVVGEGDSNIRQIEDLLDVKMLLRGDTITVSGSDIAVKTALLILEDMIGQVRDGGLVDDQFLSRAVNLRKRSEFSPSELRLDKVLDSKGHIIHPKTLGQKTYVDAIRANTITFGIGPAGTGKTYLAMAMAVAALQSKEVGRIILSRPILEAGENLGFLPGTLTEKVDPYIRPLYDALFDMVDAEYATRLLELGAIEIAPLAFMRGRTLNDSFIILDEAQNTTCEQMKMFLTRLGHGSRMVITGDLSQSDLPIRNNGLLQSIEVLDGIDDIRICTFNNVDVVRHSLVSKIISAYEKANLQ